MKPSAVFFYLCLILMLNLLNAQVPHKLSYQGVLADEKGQPAGDGDYTMTFRIYELASGGKAVWEESQSIPVTDGIFNAVLGSTNPLDLPFDRTGWLGISVAGGVELAPRIELTASAYSLNTAQVKGSGNIFGGNGNVGIGTTAPQEALEVAGTVHSTSGGFKFPDGTIQVTASAGDDLGSHTATQNLNMNGFIILNGAFVNEENLSIQTGVNMAVVAGSNIEMQSGTDLGMTTGRDLNLNSGVDLNIQSNADLGITSGQSLIIDVADAITFKCGKASITMTKNGDILITGNDISIKAAGTITLKGQLVQEN